MDSKSAAERLMDASYRKSSLKDRMAFAVNRWLGEDRRSIVAISKSGMLTYAETENVRRCAEFYGVSYTALLAEVLATVHYMFNTEPA